MLPRLPGIVIAVVGLGWLNLDWFFFVSFAELLLPLWLVTMGWRIKQPDPG